MTSAPVSAGTSAAAGHHLRRLTALRAFAALLVFLTHLDIRGGTVGPARGVLQYGYIGVGFFFLLSGFVLAWSYRPELGRADFYLRRFARVYPSHLVMTLIAVIVPVTVIAVAPSQLPPTLLLTQTWLPGVLEPYWLNGVSWSLSCEAAFYASLPFALPLLLRASPRWRWTIAVGWWGGASLVMAFVAFRHPGWQDAAYVFPPLRFGEFLLGVVAALEVRRGWRLGPRAALGVAGLGLLLALAARSSFPAPCGGAALVCLAIVVCAAQRDLAGRPGPLTSRVLVYAGQVSFGFYLVHELVLLNVSHLTGDRGWRADLLLVPAACLAAVLLHHLVERPCERRLRGLGRAGARSSLPVDG